MLYEQQSSVSKENFEYFGIEGKEQKEFLECRNSNVCQECGMILSVSRKFLTRTTLRLPHASLKMYGIHYYLNRLSVPSSLLFEFSAGCKIESGANLCTSNLN